MNLEEKRKKLIHDLNNLAQRVEFEGDESNFYTCTEVWFIARKMPVLPSMVHGIESAYFDEVIKSANSVGVSTLGCALNLGVDCTDERYRTIRREAVKRFTEMVKNKELDDYLK